MMQAHTQIDRTTVPVLADSIQNHRGGFNNISSSPAAPDRCPGAPCACSRDSVGVCVQMQVCGGTHSWGRVTFYTWRDSATDTPGFFIFLGLGCLMAGCIERAWAYPPWAAGLALPFSPPPLS